MKKKKGISLLEIVITLAILSIVGVAITNIVMFSIKTTQSTKAIMDEKDFFANGKEAVEGSKSLSEIGMNFKLSNVIDDNSTIDEELTKDYIKTIDHSKYEVRLFKLKEDNLALKLQIDKATKNGVTKRAVSKDNSNEYDIVIGEESKTLVFLSYLDNANALKYYYLLGKSDDIDNKTLEEIKALTGWQEGKEIFKIFFENNSSNNLKILAYSGKEHNNQSALNVNIILENKTEYLDDTKVAPTYDLENNSYDLNFNIITRTKIEDEYIKELGDKLEYTLEIVRYEYNGNSYTFESTNKSVSGYVPASIIK